MVDVVGECFCVDAAKTHAESLLYMLTSTLSCPGTEYLVTENGTASSASGTLPGMAWIYIVDRYLWPSMAWTITAPPEILKEHCTTATMPCPMFYSYRPIIGSIAK